MTLEDLKHLTETLLAQGTAPDTPVCIWNGEDGEVQELYAPAFLAAGPYRFDPAPKMGGYAMANRGPYLLLEATTQDVPEQARQVNN